MRVHRRAGGIPFLQDVSSRREEAKGEHGVLGLEAEGLKKLPQRTTLLESGSSNNQILAFRTNGLHVPCVELTDMVCA